MKKFKVANIHCQNCANTIKNALEDDFGTILVDLSCEPKVVSVEISDERVQEFRAELEDLGFSVIKEF
ncbi:MULTISPECIES: heavy-metal-associated domain-containing protein [unclassified Campylobacter]|uniref:heavy-metal-associated domain-containing protein n=1 Tax=unclassified Campylobacter TaxID=2593542 RepID=UPI003D346DCF